LFKDTDAICLPVYYYNQKGSWMEREIFRNWFHRHFVQKLGFSERDRIITESGVATHCPFSSEREGCTDLQQWPHYYKVYVPRVTAVVQPMDQEVIAFMK
jgi:hypothetical protein